jgi:repressor LexA
MPPDLTAKQLAVLEFIQRFMAKDGLPPTRGEIAQGLGLRNRQGIDQHLRALAGKGVIELIPGISRGIRLLEASARAAESKFSSKFRGVSETALPLPLPLLGRVAAGSPILAEENIENYVNVDPALFRPRASFLLRVRGDSMKDANIIDRDLLAVHRTTQARDGQIVVARIGEEATVKYFRMAGHIVRLEPANAAYRPIEIDLRKQSLAIEGIGLGVIRTALT